MHIYSTSTLWESRAETHAKNILETAWISVNYQNSDGFEDTQRRKYSLDSFDIGKIIILY